jgi:adenosylmethionine-8-amino-7-oxononanoate aminotransferase
MSSLLKPRLNSQLPVVSHAKGVRIYDTEGRDYIDGSGGPMTVAIGHGVPEIVAAMKTQAEQVSFTYRTQFTSRPAEELAETLARLAPGDVNHVFFVNSGSEATELCMRAAIQYWRERGQPKKTHVLGRKTSYHGMTMGALSMSGHDARRRDYAELLHPLAVGPDSHAWVGVESGSGSEIEGAEQWVSAIEQYGSDRLAAIIVEPIIGAAGGAITPPAGHLKKLRDICDAKNILLIADEVITGIGRTGTWFASEHDGVVPDLIAIAKGMTAGYTPMGAVLMSEKVVQAMREGSGAAPFGHTFSGNPLSAAICLAVLRYMQTNDVLGNANRRAPELEEGLRRLDRKYPAMTNVRGKGMLWGFDVQVPGVATPGLNGVFVSHCFDAGLIVYPAGIAPHDNAAIVSPPLTITEPELQELLGRLDAALESFSVPR